MARRRDRADWLAQLLSEWASLSVTVGWEGEGVGRGNWWVRWTDGPAVATLRGQAQTYAPHLRPLDVATLRWGRTYTMRAWAAALLTVAETRPEITDWHDLVGEAEAWLHPADWPDRAVTDADAVAADELLAAGDGGTEYDLARLVAARRSTAAVTKPGDETARCLRCGAEMARAGTGRPARYCSAACRTRAWRTRTTTTVTNPGIETVRCLSCGTEMAQAATGRPARYCSAACRTRAWRTRLTLHKPRDA